MRESEGGKPLGEAGAATPRATVVSGVSEEAVPALFTDASRRGGGLTRALAELRGGALALAVTPAFGLPALADHRAPPPHAEHAALHIAVEGVSVLASRALQDNRLIASVVPAEVAAEDGIAELPDLAEPVRAKVRAASSALHAAHASLVERAAEKLLARDRCTPSQAEAAARSLALGLLPASTRTRIYFSTNARVLGSHCASLLSHPLAEVKAMGRAILDAARGSAPELFQGVEPSKMRAAAPAELAAAVARFSAAPQEGSSQTMVISQPVRLVRHDKDALERVMLALAYEATDSVVNAFALMGSLRGAKEPALLDILRAVLRERAPGEAAPRGFEVSAMTFEIMIDAATLHELLRLRAHTASTQRLTCRLGFQLPEDLLDLGLAESYQDAMLAAQGGWVDIDAEDPVAAEYAVPLGYRVRSLWTVDLRQLLAIIEARSAKGNPMRVRRIAHGLYRTACGVLPWLRDVARIDLD
jgi:thymidylate synthase ThyX